MQAISRSGGRHGRSAVACAAYRAGIALQDSKTREIKDYSERGGVVETLILAPPGSPDWVHDREQLWNAVEAKENRRDSRLAREIDIALPRELSKQQQSELVRDFVQTQFVDQGMVADVAIHSPSRTVRNPHVHIMLTTREITPEGFGKKVRDWDRLDFLQETRERWQEKANLHLERAGLEARIDHRSLEAQCRDALEQERFEQAIELHRVPQSHKGPVATNIERHLIGSSEKLREFRKERSSDLAVYKKERELAKELLGISRGAEPRIMKGEQAEIKSLQREIFKLYSERSDVEWKLKGLEPKPPKVRQAQIRPEPKIEEKKTVEQPKRKEQSKLELARTDRKVFDSLYWGMIGDTQRAMSVCGDEVLKGIEGRQKPQLERLKGLEQNRQELEEELRFFEDQKKGFKKVLNLVYGQDPDSHIAVIKEGLKGINAEYKKLDRQLKDELVPGEVTGQARELFQKRHPDLVKLKQDLEPLRKAWERQDLQQERKGPELGLAR